MIILKFIEFLNAHRNAVRWVCYAALAACVLSSFFVEPHHGSPTDEADPHHEAVTETSDAHHPAPADDHSDEHSSAAFNPEGLPGFWAVFGLVGCAIIIEVSKFIGSLGLMKPEDYYDDE